MSVEVKNLVKIYDKQVAVSDISFVAERGKITGFLGPNGAGKSTTMKIATCFIPPTSGTILVNGMDVTENPIEVKKNIGYLPEHNPLYLDMYVHEYLHFIGSLYQMKGQSLSSEVKKMIELCGLSIEQNKKIGALSKGYRQRVGLAQAILPNPSVLILDEPTTGLDPNQIVEIRQLIKNISTDKTVIFSTHIMQEVQALCDQVVIINKGKIVANSTIAELKHLNLSGKVIKLQFTHSVELLELSQLPHVANVVASDNHSYELHLSTSEDVRSVIFKSCADKQWTLIEMKEEERSLENIFRDLTTSME
ncbi:MAG: gliding motility-associated ABC transporter ATP-binding subunit GldA [Cytophagaceae bacterium]